jgi:hypothetical protein
VKTVRLLPGAVCLAFALFGVSGFLVAQPAAQPPIRLPDSPPVPEPMPVKPPAPAPVLPGAPLKVTPELLYVFDSDVDAVVLTSPPGLAKVTREDGPIKIHGRFAEQPDRVKTRTFKGKHVYTLEVLAAGRVEIIVVPGGAKDESAVVRRLVDLQTAPQPPPGPDPDPEPEPKPKPPKPDHPQAARIAVVVVGETQNQTPAQGKLLLDRSVRDWLKAGGHSLDLVEHSDPAAKANGFLPYADRAGLPAVLVFDAGATGPQVPLKTFKLPDTAAAWRAELEACVRR